MHGSLSLIGICTQLSSQVDRTLAIFKKWLNIKALLLCIKGKDIPVLNHESSDKDVGEK